MKLGLSITSKLTLVFVLFAAILVIAVEALAYNNGRAVLQEAVTSELRLSSLEKEAAFNKWIEDRRLQLLSLSQVPEIIETTTTLMTTTTFDEAQPAHDSLITNLRPWRQRGGFQDLLVVDVKYGRVMAATDPTEEGKFRENRPYFIHGKQGPYVQGPYYSPALQALAMTASTPVYSTDGHLIAVLAGRLNMAELNEIMQRRTGVHQTDDAYLLNGSNLFVTQPRLLEDMAILRRGVHNPVVDTCLAGQSGTASTNDYQDRLVFIVYRWLAEHQLCLVVKLDQAEALAPAQILGLTTVLIGAIAMLAATALAIGLARTITQPVLALQQGVLRFTQGELDVRLPETAQDELGLLAHQFNQMAESLATQAGELRIYSAELEARVEERTVALAASEQRFRQVVEATPNAMVVVDREGKITLVNSQTELLFGYRREELIGQPVEILVPERLRQIHPDLRDQFMTRPEVRPMGKGRELYGIRKDGGEIPVEIGLSPMEAEGELSVLSVITDITERKRVEGRLKQHADELARSNADLEQFAYVASHDLQEPLRMITSYLQLLERRYRDKLDSDAQEFIGYAVDGATRMKTLIKDLLAYSRVSTRIKAFKPISSEVVLERVLTNLQLVIAETEAMVTHDPLPTVLGDETQLQQLFQNLIGNALKFRRDLPPRIHIGVTLHEGQWLFSFRDNGVGFEPQYAERIFVIFQRLHGPHEFPGTGIGLAVCKKIIERHGGRIWVESQSGQGSTFYFTLPIEEEKSDQSNNG